ncbi:MAG: ERF family protein [Gammaproteobacteria bacterium]|nr:ERF family protein [Gammaproteobacteria bacterium]
MKLTDIQNELHAKKSCFNSFGKYHYRKCEDILEALKPLLKKHSASLTISDDVLTVGNYTFIEATVSLKTEDAEYTSKAQAGIEKAGGMALPQAFGSASSYARKYALGAMFLLDDTEDADASNTHDTESKKPVAKKPAAKPAPKDSAKKAEAMAAKSADSKWFEIVWPFEKPEKYNKQELAIVAAAGDDVALTKLEQYFVKIASEETPNLNALIKKVKDAIEEAKSVKSL